MSIEAYKWLAKFAVLLAIVGAVFAYGYKVAEDKLEPQIIALKAQLLAIDLKAKQDAISQKENMNVIEKDHITNQRALSNYYDGLLQRTRNQASPPAIARSTETMDTAGRESRLTTCSIETEHRCVKDAALVEEMAKFFTINPFPIISPP